VRWLYLTLNKISFFVVFLQCIFLLIYQLHLTSMDPKKWIDINTESFQYSLDHFVIPDHYETALSSVLIPHGVIMDRVEKLAKLIVQESTGPLVVCCVLKGGHQFFADLVNYIKKNVTRGGKTVPLSLEFIKVKSYSGETSGEVKLSLTDEECKEFSGKVRYDTDFQWVTDSRIAFLRTAIK
jgi:hypothetical protein